MNIKQHIPNLLTLTNLLCGCLLIVSLFYNQIELSNSNNSFGSLQATMNLNPSFLFLILISISLLADLLDGMVARWLNVASPMGLQLDSFADMVTFGVFPGFLMAKMMNEFSTFTPFSILGLGITLFSALRLAKFNIDTTQTSYFKGLATPANTIFILGIYFLKEGYPEFFTENGFNILLATTIVSCYLLVANVPLFSFKLKSFKTKDILPQILLVIFSIILLIFLGLKALAPIILVYIILSILFRKTFAHT